jgi:hypothetical protein
MSDHQRRRPAATGFAFSLPFILPVAFVDRDQIACAHMGDQYDHFLSGCYQRTAQPMRAPESAVFFRQLPVPAQFAVVSEGE